jgi:predicted MFS family arabinose efflux permease
MTGRGGGPLAVALAGLSSLALAVGIGRFGFTPLLPLMLHDGVVTLQEASALATANYVGYLLGAVLCLLIRPDPAWIVRAALAGTVVLTLAMAVPGGIAAWVLWRAGAGICSAVVMVHSTAWCMHRLSELGRPTLGALLFCGPGIGIVLTGMSAYTMVARQWPASWGWVAFAILGLAMLGPIWRIFASPSPSMLAAPALQAPSATDHSLKLETWALTLAYGLAGFGYIVTATFLPVIARLALPGSVWVDLFWPILGVAAAAGSWLVTRVGMHQDNRRMMLFLYLMQAAGVSVAAVFPTVLGFTFSSMLVGIPFTALVSFAMREARRLWGVNASELIGVMTAAYAVGQIAGPPLATALVTRTGGFGTPLAVAASALLAGALIFAWMWRSMPMRGHAVA